ncbi:tetratricopeptide repeat protein [Sorangium sp. So ce394]|uniref:tetratricopeptide repeat protein n=1 Tax=Sorangium sp. So ce394 TaxID=3133310 RepID=UPI003F5C137F
MSRTGSAVWTLVLVLVAACSGARTPQLRGMQDVPAAVAAVAAKQPTIVRVQGNLWVVGLPARHGWARERRVLLTKRNVKHGIDVKVGVVVVLDDSYATAAPVGIMYEEPGASFDGALARIVGSDERLRIGRGFGSLSQVTTTSVVELDLGRRDGVGVGDVYEVRGREGTGVIGRVRVVSLEDTRAKAEVINAGPFAAGQEVVYQPQRGDEAVKGAAVTVVVCDFEPKARDKDVVLAGQAFAFDLAKHLREAAGHWKGLEVKQASQMVGDDEKARKLGRAYRADVVVWGTAMCISGRGCALPVFTVVDPGRLATARFEGKEVRFDPVNPRESLERGTASDPAGLVFGLLGSLTFAAQRYGDAAFYLGRVPEGALKGEERYRALRDLCDAQYFLGRLESAMDSAVKLERAAQGHPRGWAMVGARQRARLLAVKGEVDDALKLYREALAVFEALGARHSRAVTLGDIARLLEDKGEVDEALKLHREALAVFEALGARHSRAGMLVDIARLLAKKGEVDEALKLHREALAVFEALGDRRSRAGTLGDIASLLEDKGKVDEALRLHRERLAVFEALGDRSLRAGTLGDIARILEMKGEVDKALKLHREALAVYEALGARRSRAITLGDIARLLEDKGEADEALKLHRERLAVFEALGDRSLRAGTLGDVASLLEDKGDVDEALKLYREALAVFEALGARHSRAITLGDIARLLAKKGEVDEALKLHREALAVFEVLGNRRSRAVALGYIARLLAKKGEVDEALKLHREQLAVFEALGGGRDRAVTLGDIARLLAKKGEVDEALKLHRERLAVFEALGARRSRAAALVDIAQIHLYRKEIATALPMLRESYEIALALGDAYGAAFVGSLLARTLLQAGAKKDAEPVVARASEALIKIGRPTDAEALRALLRAPRTP